MPTTINDTPHHIAVATTSAGVLSTIQLPTIYPAPSSEDVLIKVHYASLVALDGYISDHAYHVKEHPVVLGYNATGIVEAVGGEAKGLAVGDRVMAFAFGFNSSKAMQEYCLVPYYKCAKVPESVSLTEAATIPDNLVTAYHSILHGLGLGIPKNLPVVEGQDDDLTEDQKEKAVVIYGAGATSGQYTIQVLHAAGYRNIIAIASERHHSYLKSLGATHTFSYTSPTLTADINSHLNSKIHFALDCISTFSTIRTISQLLDPDDSTLALLLPIKAGDKVTPEREGGALGLYMQLPTELMDNETVERLRGVKVVGVETFKYAEDEFLKYNLMPRILPSLLASGIIQPNRVRLFDEATHETLQGRVEIGLELLRNNKITGEKVVIKVA